MLHAIAVTGWITRIQRYNYGQPAKNLTEKILSLPAHAHIRRRLLPTIPVLHRHVTILREKGGGGGVSFEVTIA